MPTQQDVQRLIALREARKRGMMGPTQTAALQEIERRMSMGDQVAKVAEPAMTIASSMVAEPLSGLAGIAGTILPGPQGQGADWVNRTQEALTYMPRTEGGMQSLQGLASLMQPVSDVMQGAEQSMGDFGYENFGPGVGAMMAAIPAAASEVAGVGKPARAARRADDVVDAARKAKPFKLRTGDPDVDKKITEVKMMTPDEYLQQAYEATDARVGGSFEGWMASNQRDADDVARYADAMKSGDEFPMPYIDFDLGSQDGRNRALAAKAAGIEEIPVGIVPAKTAQQRIMEIRDELKGAKGYRKFKLESELKSLGG